MVHAAIAWLGEVGSGGESSPLSATSQFAELLRLIQVGIFAGVLYLIKGIKESKGSSDATHSKIISDITSLGNEIQEQRKERQHEIAILRDEIKGLQTRKEVEAKV